MSARLESLPDYLEEAARRREPLKKSPDTTAYRLLHGNAEGVSDVTVDVFEHVYVVSLYRDRDPSAEEAILDGVTSVWSPRSLYLKRRPKEARHTANVDKAQAKSFEMNWLGSGLSTSFKSF